MSDRPLQPIRGRKQPITRDFCGERSGPKFFFDKRACVEVFHDCKQHGKRKKEKEKMRTLVSFFPFFFGGGGGGGGVKSRCSTLLRVNNTD